VPARGSTIGECSVVVFRGVALEQRWVRSEFLAATVKLAFAAEDHFCPGVEGANGAAELDVESAILFQIANIFSVRVKADDGEAALGVSGQGAAEIEKPGAVGELNNIVDVGHEAHILIQVLPGEIGRDAAILLRPRGGRDKDESNDPCGAAHRVLLEREIGLH